MIGNSDTILRTDKPVIQPFYFQLIFIEQSTVSFVLQIKNNNENGWRNSADNHDSLINTRL
jgi:hypothetical protein